MYDMILTVSAFLAEHTAVIVAFLLGVLITLLAWLKKHPEDFYTVTYEDDAAPTFEQGAERKEKTA